MEASPLNKLPAELRNQIYELTMYRRKAINLVANTKLRSLKATTRVPIALTVTCREIRKDTRSMFYTINKFIITTSYFDYQSSPRADTHTDRKFARIRNWLEAIGPANRKQLTHVCFKLGTYDFDAYQSILTRTLYDLWQALRHRFYDFGLPASSLHVSFDARYTAPVFKRPLHFHSLPLNDRDVARRRILKVFENETKWQQNEPNKYFTARGSGLIAGKLRQDLHNAQLRVCAAMLRD